MMIKKSILLGCLLNIASILSMENVNKSLKEAIVNAFDDAGVNRKDLSQDLAHVYLDIGLSIAGTPVPGKKKVTSVKTFDPEISVLQPYVDDPSKAEVTTHDPSTIGQKAEVTTHDPVAEKKAEVTTHGPVAEKKNPSTITSRVTSVTQVKQEPGALAKALKGLWSSVVGD